MMPESPLSILEKMSHRLAAIVREVNDLQVQIMDMKYSLNEPVREEIKARNQKRGRFEVGDKVEWQGIKGKVLLIVPAHSYPHTEFVRMFPGQKYNARTRGYYRYEESYLVVDEKGQQYWPRAGWLKLLEKKNG